jgi:quinol monooxygenase YgiN
MSVVVIATIIPIPEHRAEVIKAFETVITRVLKEEPSVERYALHEGPDRLIMIEKWASKEELAEHRTKPALAELRTALAGKLSSDLDVQEVTPHPVGTAPQVTL